MMHINRLYPVNLIAVSERAKKVLHEYKNNLLLQEYDDYGRPLCICPNGKQGIFCISPDRFWNGWFELDTDVIFSEQEKLSHYLKNKD